MSGGQLLSGALLNTFHKCNLTTGIWTTLHTMSSARAEHVMVLNKNGKITFLGGRIDGGTTFTNLNQEYDIDLDTFTNKYIVPKSLAGHSAYSASNGKIYLFSGNDNGLGNISTYEYDVDSDTWANKLNSNYIFYNSGIAEYNGKMYLFGGTYTGSKTKVQAYDFTSNTWTAKTDISGTGKEGKYGFYGKIGNGFYIGAGATNKNNTYYYDFANNTWSNKTTTANENSIISGSGAVVYANNIIYGFGLYDFGAGFIFSNRICKYITPVELKIRYTTNGSDPTAFSTQYTTPIKITISTTLKAIAIAD